MKKRIASYECDAGSCVINGIGFNNGWGDGGFDIYYTDTLSLLTMPSRGQQNWLTECG